jgi:predicted ATPase/DNA-binding SARP family transcriptional activator
LAITDLHIRLLGEFSLTYSGVSVTGFGKARLQSLLAYLVLHASSPQPRQHVAFLLWPDTPEPNARNNLRQLLHQLRLALPDPDRLLAVDAQTVHWQLDGQQSIDLHDFQRALAEADAAARQGDARQARHWLEQALAVYQGDLLPGCYDEWVSPERERLRQQHRRARQQLAALLEDQGAYAEAALLVQALLDLDPLDEETGIWLMRLHALNRDRQGVRRAFQRSVDALRRELEVEPSPALQKAYAHWLRAAEAPPAEAASEGTVLALIGRQAEWQQLQRAWQRALKGECLLALVTGEAGIGKSRLAEQLYNAAGRQLATTAHTRSYAAEGRLSLAPIIDWLRSPALRPHLVALSKLDQTEIARVLPELVTGQTDIARPEPISEFGRRQRFFEALARAVFAAPPPRLLWVDDLQWCDPETLEWLHYLLRVDPRAALLVLGTARSEEAPAGHPLAAVAQQLRAEGKLVSIELSPLDAAETAQLAGQIEGQALSVEAALQLYRATEGNPLFVVETMRAGLRSAPASEASSAAAALPPRVHAVIAQRLAQLSPGTRRVVELAAAVGRAFSLDVLRQAGSGGEAAAVQALDELWQKRVIREQRPGLFDFTHDKLREVAYAEISAPQRRFLHRRIAEAMEALYSGDLDAVSAQIAAHYEQAGMFAQAIPYFQRAGSVAAQVYANNDAIQALTRALALLEHLPAGPRRESQELSLRLAISPLYSITQGWAAAEVEQTLDRALILANKVGDAAQRAQTLYSLQTVYAVQARMDQVQALYLPMRAFFEQTQGTPPPFAELMVTASRFHQGQLAAARRQFEDMLAVRDDRYLRSLQASQGVNYLVMGHSYYAHILWCLGYPRAALDSSAAAIRFAHEYEQPLNRAMAITYAALLHEWCAEPEAFQAYAADASRLTRENQAPYYQAWANILAAFGRGWREPSSPQVAHLRDAIRLFAEGGAHLRLPLYFSLLARVSQRGGQVKAAEAALQQALAEAQQTGEHCWDAELYRLRGELKRAQGAPADEVEGDFQRAIAIAQSQAARSLELRAATSLARLWQDLERPEDARQCLAPVYDWFTEGLETPDLRAAAARLTELRGPEPPLTPKITST